jgi:putative hydrolase
MSIPFPRHDMHVHSTFSDGAATPRENIRRAEELGLDALTLVDHVRTSSDWLPRFVAHLETLRRSAALDVLIGVEAKILTIGGLMDRPERIGEVDRVYIADHQVPGHRGPERPSDVRRELAAGRRHPDAVIDAVVQGTANAMRAQPEAVLAHLFSVLPKVGLDEGLVSDEQIGLLAETAAQTGATLELSERWKCPGTRVARAFLERGVPIVVSSDSHRLDSLGAFTWCRERWEELARRRPAPAPAMAARAAGA